MTKKLPVSPPPQTHPSLPVRILTHNIRYAIPHPVKGEAPWPVRLPLLLNELRYNTRYTPTAFVCLQEVLHGQLQDILVGLNGSHNVGGEWTHIGTGRDDGVNEGEFNPILYRPAIWARLESFQIWLSPTPDKPSKGWDAGCNRVLVAGCFEHRQSGKRVVALNTHLDDRSEKARRKGAEVIVDFVRAKGWVEAGLPVFLAGDFNSPPDSAAYRVLAGGRLALRDLYAVVPRERHYGHDLTFTGFGTGEDDPPERIDYVLVGKNGWRVEGYAVLESRFEDGLFVSDHRAVVGDLMIE